MAGAAFGYLVGFLIVAAIMWAILSKVLSKQTPEPEPEPEPVKTPDVVLYYNSEWPNPSIKYSQNGETPWKTEQLSKNTDTSISSSPYYINFYGSSNITFVLTDGNNNWDNNGGKNYTITDPGMYELSNGVLSPALNI